MNRPATMARIARIGPLLAHEAEAFFAYLNDHLRDNGSPETGYFQPQERAASCFPAEREQAFREGLAIPVGRPGWRRAWIARATQAPEQIVGHVDLRAHAEPCAAHRCLLGMGVDRHHRRGGLGADLLAQAVDWAGTQPPLAWIDLTVLSRNEAARRLYQRQGFVQTGEVAEMYMLDGQPHALTHMSRGIGVPAGLR